MAPNRATRSCIRTTNAGLTQSGEEPGWYAGPPGSRAWRQVWWSLRTEGSTSNDDSMMPTGVGEAEPDPLVEAQGPGSEGVPKGLSRGPLPGLDAGARWAATELFDCGPEAEERPVTIDVAAAFEE